MFMFNHQRKLQSMPIRNDGVRTKAEQVIWKKSSKSLQSLQSGDPYGIRTRVAAVKGRCPKPLDERDLGYNLILIKLLKVNQVFFKN